MQSMNSWVVTGWKIYHVGHTIANHWNLQNQGYKRGSSNAYNSRDTDITSYRITSQHCSKKAVDNESGFKSSMIC